MGSLTDFLFEGTPPKSVTTYGETIKDMPKWLSDYTQGLISRSNAVASEGYIPYSGPRIAGFTPDQSQAFDTTRGNVGKWQPGMTQAQDLTAQAGNQSPLMAASPYMLKAGQTFPEAVDQYMDPYVGNVINRSKMEAQRFYDENLMPGLDNKFIRGGQYGSSAHMREAERGTRDLTEGLNSQGLAALSGAYTNAGQMFGADASRQGALAQTAGTLANQEAQIKLGAGAQSGQLSQALQSMGIKDAASLEAVGSAQQGQDQRNLDLAYGDFKEQRDYPKSTIDWMSSVIRGLPTPESTRTTNVGPSQVSGPSGLSQLAALGTAIAGWNESNKGNARGGYVDGYAEGGKVSGLQEAVRVLKKLGYTAEEAYAKARKMLQNQMAAYRRNYDPNQKGGWDSDYWDDQEIRDNMPGAGRNKPKMAEGGSVRGITRLLQEMKMARGGYIDGVAYGT